VADTPAPVLIAGGGIAGLTMALTCHQVGVAAIVLESVRAIAPLGVGINLQPNAIRELIDLGLGDELDAIGIEATEWALVGRGGNDVWAEPRGRAAGYDWPQYSVHRGELQMLLHRTALERMGPDAVKPGHRVVEYRNSASGVTALVDTRDGNTLEMAGTLLIAADGLHSSVRAQMHPDQPEPHWGGQVLWRGATPGSPIRSGAAFTLVGNLDQRFVHYPISSVDPTTGLQLQNWIAELTVDTTSESDGNGHGDPGHVGSDWNKRVDVDSFLPAFEDWTFDWLDIPGLVRGAPAVWEFPMVDRDPVDRWVDGRVCLVGDAAHVMYPVGSNGASQAIVDARVMGAQFLEFGVHPDALAAFEARLIEPMSALVLRNRGHGPIGILELVDERCGGYFDDIDDVIPRQDVEAFMADYKAAAGFAVESLNAAPPTIPPGARVTR
jgi:2-polyprenyl-6-methoxyphenol hydroxylase-like FAD-dependent oxidoreductase